MPNFTLFDTEGLERHPKYPAENVGFIAKLMINESE
jgi:hypothetical protein